MGTPTRGLESQALKLPARDRPRLAEPLISSLDDEIEPDAEKVRAEEADRRLEELGSGRAKAKSAASVFRKARSAPR